MKIAHLTTLSKKQLLMACAAVVLLSIFVVAGLFWQARAATTALEQELKITRTKIQQDIKSLTTNLGKLDPAEAEDTKKALTALEKLDSDLAAYAKLQANRSQPVIHSGKFYKKAAAELANYASEIANTKKALTELITTVRYHGALGTAIEPAIKTAASSDAVNASKQASAWQQAVDALQKVTPDSANKDQHTKLIAAAGEIIKYTKEIATAQEKKDPDAFAKANESLNKSYEAVNEAAEAMRVTLKDKQIKLYTTGKKLQ